MSQLNCRAHDCPVIYMTFSGPLLYQNEQLLLCSTEKKDIQFVMAREQRKSRLHSFLGEMSLCILNQLDPVSTLSSLQWPVQVNEGHMEATHSYLVPVRFILKKSQLLVPFSLAMRHLILERPMPSRLTAATTAAPFKDVHHFSHYLFNLDTHYKCFFFCGA